MALSRFKIIRQLNTMDCGPACLAMILSFYGKSYSLEYLKEKTSLSKSGVSLLSLSNVSKSLGFKTTAGLFTFEALINTANLPCILHWNQNHFVVLYRVKAKKDGYMLFVADPAKGKLAISESVFCEGWLSTTENNKQVGIALLLEPVNIIDMPTVNSSCKNAKTVLKYISSHKKILFQLILGLISGSILQLAFPFLTQTIVDVGIANKDISFISVILLAQLMLFIGQTTIEFLRNRILLFISTYINISLISDFFVKLLKLPMSYFDTRLFGDLVQRIQDHNRVEGFLTSYSLSFLFSIFTIIVFGVVLLIYNVTIFLIFLCGTSLYCLWVVLFLKKRRLLDYKLFDQQSKNHSITYQLLSSIQEIKLQGNEDRKRWDWERNQSDLFKTNLESLSLQQSQEAGGIAINQLKNIVITIISATSVINGDITLGMMLSIQFMIGQLNLPVDQVVTFILKLQDVKLSWERIGEVHAKENENTTERNIPIPSEKLYFSINLNSVSFKYDIYHKDFILKDINISIAAGEKTAIVGASGSGKTTLIKLMLGYYVPQQGKINVGESDLSKIRLDEWRKVCGTVMQDGFIFSESIEKNITMSEAEVNRKMLEYSIKTACIDKYIASLPLGLDTIIGQDGQKISQGQKQRILIARAIYRNPKVLFFDEATNSLDSINEKRITENLNDFYKNKTVIIVAHRLSTVKDADQIIVMDQGEIVERGNHEFLINLKGKYYSLIKEQLELE